MKISYQLKNFFFNSELKVLEHLKFEFRFCVNLTCFKNKNSNGVFLRYSMAKNDMCYRTLSDDWCVLKRKRAMRRPR